MLQNEICEKGTLDIYCANVRSLRANFDSALCLIENKNIRFDVIIMTEIWIWEHEINLYNIDGYTAYFSTSSDSRAGGCAVFVNNKHIINRIHIDCSNAEVCVVSLTIADSTFEMCCVSITHN